MSGRRPLIKGYFAVLRLMVGPVMSSDCWGGVAAGTERRSLDRRSLSPWPNQKPRSRLN
jgi:hypothetical protein